MKGREFITLFGGAGRSRRARSSRRRRRFGFLRKAQQQMQVSFFWGSNPKWSA
jgi:hypothetical protein